MNRRSSAARLAATGWLMSRQCTRSAPRSSVPVGRVPGIRLERAQNALRSPPGGKRNGQAANPGRSCMFGLSARQATSAPETTDWRKKLAASFASAASLSRDPTGGKKRRLVQVAAAAAARPTGRSAGAHPEIMSQKARNSAARKAAVRARVRGASPAGALKRPIQRAPRTPDLFERTARGGTAGRKSGQDDRRRRSPFEISIRLLGHSAALSCSRRRRKELLATGRAPSTRAPMGACRDRPDLEKPGSEEARRHDGYGPGATSPRIDSSTSAQGASPTGRTNHEGGRAGPPATA